MSSNFSTQYRIYYEDTDSGGVVYYANYLKFFERCRTEFLRSLNISQSKLAQEENTIFVVRRCEIDYISPARLDDLVEISVLVERISSASIKMSQEMKISDRVLSKLQVEIISITADSFKPKRLNQNLKDILIQNN